MALSRFQMFFRRKPILSNTLLFVGMYSASDICVQTLIAKKRKLDLKSTGRVATLAAVYFGPVLPPYYKWLDKVWPGTRTTTIAKKLMFDTGVMGLVGSVVFFAGTGYLEGKNNSQVWRDVREKVPPAFLLGFAYWPLVQSLNFRYMPTHCRSAYVAVAAFIWTNIICYIKQMNPRESPMDHREVT